MLTEEKTFFVDAPVAAASSSPRVHARWAGAKFDNASPVTRIHPDAPPFLVIHVDCDHVIPVQEARAFVTQLQSVSSGAVHYLEIPAVATDST